jgi:hypothetical protein
MATLMIPQGDYQWIIFSGIKQDNNRICIIKRNGRVSSMQESLTPASCAKRDAPPFLGRRTKPLFGMMQTGEGLSNSCVLMQIKRIIQQRDQSVSGTETGHGHI